ncbi:MAG: hypothetical protein IJ907_03335 [Prevotella sp.]|nr:hypothetical protein [Prevotella sp.]
MKNKYFKPQFKVVKLHGRMPLMVNSLATKGRVNSVSSGGLGQDNLDYGGDSDNDTEGIIR